MSRRSSNSSREEEPLLSKAASAVSVSFQNTKSIGAAPSLASFGPQLSSIGNSKNPITKPDAASAPTKSSNSDSEEDEQKALLSGVRLPPIHLPVFERVNSSRLSRSSLDDTEMVALQRSLSLGQGLLPPALIPQYPKDSFCIDDDNPDQQSVDSSVPESEDSLNAKLSPIRLKIPPEYRRHHPLNITFSSKKMPHVNDQRVSIIWAGDRRMFTVGDAIRLALALLPADAADDVRRAVRVSKTPLYLEASGWRLDEQWLIDDVEDDPFICLGGCAPAAPRVGDVDPEVKFVLVVTGSFSLVDEMGETMQTDEDIDVASRMTIITTEFRNRLQSEIQQLDDLKKAVAASEKEARERLTVKSRLFSMSSNKYGSRGSQDLGAGGFSETLKRSIAASKDINALSKWSQRVQDAQFSEFVKSETESTQVSLSNIWKEVKTDASIDYMKRKSEFINFNNSLIHRALRINERLLQVVEAEDVDIFTDVGNAKKVMEEATKTIAVQAKSEEQLEEEKERYIREKLIREQLRARHKFNVFRDLVFYVTFLIVFCCVSYGSRGINSDGFSFISGISELVVQSNIDDSFSFFQVDNDEQMYRWLVSFFRRLLPDSSTVVPSHLKIISLFDYIYGGIVMQQTRTKATSCDIDSYIDVSNTINRCYPPSDMGGTSSSSPFGSRKEYTVNSDPGYSVTLPIDYPLVVDILDSLQYNNWIDKVILTFGYPATDSVIPTASFLPLKYFRLWTVDHYALLALESVFMAYVIYFIWELIDGCLSFGWRYFQNHWNVVDAVNVVLFIPGVFLRFYTLYYTQVNPLPTAVTYYVDLTYIQSISEVENILSSANSILLFIKIFKYLQRSQTISALVDVIVFSGGSTGYFLILLVVIFLAFSLAGFVAFGFVLASYSTFLNSIVTLFYASIGQISYDDLQSVKSIFGPIFFFCWIILLTFILTNTFISILGNAYAVSHVDPRIVNDMMASQAFESIVHERCLWYLAMDAGGDVDIGDFVKGLPSIRNSDGDIVLQALSDWWGNFSMLSRSLGDLDVTELFDSYDSNHQGRLNLRDQKVMSQFCLDTIEEYRMLQRIGRDAL